MLEVFGPMVSGGSAAGANILINPDLPSIFSQFPFHIIAAPNEPG
jgi:hypothetical protein